jgi:hypothetical protein
MKIAICGSMKVYEQMEILGQDLTSLGNEIVLPNIEGTSVDYSSLDIDEQVKLKSGFVSNYLKTIRKSDAILVANFDQKNKPNYIGSNTFLEMACGFALGKRIYIWKELPEQENKLEIAGMLPIILKQDLSIFKS